MTSALPPLPPAGLLLNETLESTATQRTLVALTPGRSYNISLAAEAGGLQSPAHLEEQTGRGGLGGAEGRGVLWNHTPL